MQLLPLLVEWLTPVVAVQMCHIILESDEPRPDPERFSPLFCEFVGQCVRKDPAERLPADILLGGPWLTENGATDLPSAAANVRAWIEEMTGGADEAAAAASAPVEYSEEGAPGAGGAGPGGAGGDPSMGDGDDGYSGDGPGGGAGGFYK